jgi:hypothetical protein
LVGESGGKPPGPSSKVSATILFVVETEVMTFGKGETGCWTAGGFVGIVGIESVELVGGVAIVELFPGVAGVAVDELPVEVLSGALPLPPDSGMLKESSSPSTGVPIIFSSLGLFAEISFFDKTSCLSQKNLQLKFQE